MLPYFWLLLIPGNEAIRCVGDCRGEVNYNDPYNLPDGCRNESSVESLSCEVIILLSYNYQEILIIYRNSNHLGTSVENWDFWQTIDVASGSGGTLLTLFHSFSCSKGDFCEQVYYNKTVGNMISRKPFLEKIAEIINGGIAPVPEIRRCLGSFGYPVDCYSGACSAELDHHHFQNVSTIWHNHSDCYFNGSIFAGGNTYEAEFTNTIDFWYPDLLSYWTSEMKCNIDMCNTPETMELILNLITQFTFGPSENFTLSTTTTPSNSFTSINTSTYIADTTTTVNSSSASVTTTTTYIANTKTTTNTLSSNTTSSSDHKGCSIITSTIFLVFSCYTLIQ